MFNTYINETEYVPYTKTVNVNNAPTTESVKLLREMQEAAVKDLVSVINVQNNVLNFSVHVFITQQTFTQFAQVQYKLNDKQYTFKIELPSRYEAKDIYATADLVLKRITEHIAQIFTGKVIGEMVDMGLIKR